MRVIIAGSRSVKDYATLLKAIDDVGIADEIEEIVSGGALGVDTLAEEYAEREGIPLRVFYPDWKRFGRAAGPIRNEQMVGYSDALIAIWDGHSVRTKNMIEAGRKAGIRMYVHVLEGVALGGVW